MVGGHVKPKISIIVDNNYKNNNDNDNNNDNIPFSAPVSQAVVEESVQITLGPSGFKKFFKCDLIQTQTVT